MANIQHKANAKRIVVMAEEIAIMSNGPAPEVVANRDTILFLMEYAVRMVIHIETREPPAAATVHARLQSKPVRPAQYIDTIKEGAALRDMSVQEEPVTM